MMWLGLALTVIGVASCGWLLGFGPGGGISIPVGEAAGFALIALTGLMAVAGLGLMIYAGLR